MSLTADLSRDCQHGLQHVVFSWVSTVIREHVLFIVSSTLDLTFFLSIFLLSCTAVTVAWLNELLWRCASCMQTCLERSLSLSLYSVLHQNSSLSFLPLPTPSTLIKKIARERDQEMEDYIRCAVGEWSGTQKSLPARSGSLGHNVCLSII